MNTVYALFRVYWIESFYECSTLVSIFSDAPNAVRNTRDIYLGKDDDVERFTIVELQLDAPPYFHRGSLQEGGEEVFSTVAVWKNGRTKRWKEQWHDDDFRKQAEGR
jgi:hypothetical protein